MSGTETTSTDTPAVRNEAGQLLDGRFFLQRPLGEGNFAEVWLAEQRVFDLLLRPVALKLFRGDQVTYDNAAEKLNDFVMLIQLQQEQSHPAVASHLVSVFDAGLLRKPDGRAFVAMEYVEGYPTVTGGSIRTLQGLIRAFRPVPVDLALRWMIQILHPLAWMHSLPRPVIHCDLKPDNILACGKDTLKVADFGLAQLAIGLLGTSTDAGALTCQAPETLAGLYPTPAADVYSLGLILYEMLAGKNPLAEVGMEASAQRQHEKYREQQVQARLDGLPPLPDCEHPDRPAGERLRDHPLLVEIVDRCLRFKASARYDNAGALLRAIEDYAEGREVVVLPPEQDGPDERPDELTLERLLAESEVLLRKGRHDEARERCERARQRFPNSAKPYRGLADIHLDQGQWQQSLAVCAEGRQVDPDEPELFEAIARAYDEGGQPGAAKAMRARAAELRKSK